MKTGRAVYGHSMLAPLNSATRTRRVTAELLVVAVVAILLVTAFRIGPEWISRHVTLLNGPPLGDEAWRVGLRGLLLLAALVLLRLRPALVSLASKMSLGGLAPSTVPVVLAVAASAVTVEAFLHWMPPRIVKGLAVYPYGAPHPRYGWTGQPSSTTTVRVSGRDIVVAFNREGVRVQKQDDEPDPTLPTILFTGESIGLGFGLQYPESYPALVAARRGVQCVNLAGAAYGSDQAYLRLMDAMPRFERLVATVTVFIPLQLGRNLYDDRPRLVLGPTGELALVPAATDFLSRLGIRKLLWKGLPYLGDRAIDQTLSLTSAILRETSIRTRARGATPVFVIPSHGPKRPLDEHAEAWIVRALFVKQGLPFILVDIPADERLSGDFHPGPRGDETIAAAILAALGPASSVRE
jgi:hypothetical protein